MMMDLQNLPIWGWPCQLHLLLQPSGTHFIHAPHAQSFLHPPLWQNFCQDCKWCSQHLTANFPLTHWASNVIVLDMTVVLKFISLFQLNALKIKPSVYGDIHMLKYEFGRVLTNIYMLPWIPMPFLSQSCSLSGHNTQISAPARSKIWSRSFFCNMTSSRSGAATSSHQRFSSANSCW